MTRLFPKVFVGKIPRDVYEDELVPLFSRHGRIYEMRLMMDFNGNNRGYAFVVFSTKKEAQNAVRMLNNYEVCPGGWGLGDHESEAMILGVMFKLCCQLSFR